MPIRDLPVADLTNVKSTNANLEPLPGKGAGADSGMPIEGRTLARRKARRRVGGKISVSG